MTGRFRRLTDAEARSLTRRELLGRIEAEQAYWHRGHRDRRDPDGYLEFTRIMHAYLGPAALAGAMQDTIDFIEGRSPGRWWDMRPGEEVPELPAMDEYQRAGLEYARGAFGIGRRDALGPQDGGRRPGTGEQP